VSTVAKQLDAVVAASHARPLKDQYRVLMLDGVVLARKTGAGAIRRPVLVALGLRPDGKKEIIDFRLAKSESAAEWERFRYVRVGRDRIEKDPDRRVQEALSLVFAKFAEFHSVRQVHVWLRDEGIALPVASHRAAEGRSIVWRLQLYNTVHNILTNPVYADAYAFGRTMSKVSVEDGRKRIKRRFAAPAVGMGCAAQGSARRLYHLERVRQEPARDCQ
jgi:hypothetical protein